MDKEGNGALIMDALGISTYNRPYVCENCGGIMVFKGCGEYACEECNFKAYDDYGKVRNYIEMHVGATAAEIESKTGVSQRSIRQMLKESKLEITADSVAFMRCEMCGAEIRSGRFCPKCEAVYHKTKEKQMREKLKGFGIESEDARRERNSKGEKRFLRDE